MAYDADISLPFSFTTGPIYSAQVQADLDEITDKFNQHLDRVPFNVKDYGAVGDGTTDDTAAIQAAIDACEAAAGGMVWFPRGNYVFTTLTVDRYVTLAGAGAQAARLLQKAGTASVFLSSARSPKTGLQFVSIRDLQFTAENNPTANTGGIDLEGATFCTVERCQIGYTKNFGIRVKGGSVQGDAMYNSILNNVIQNAGSGAAILLSCEAAGGSHPDATKIAWNTINNCPVGIQIDAAAIDAAGALCPDSCDLIGNATVETAAPLTIHGQAHRLIGNRFEVTSGTMTVTVGAGTTNNPTSGVVFIGNVYATYGDPTKLTFTDNSTTGATRLFDSESLQTRNTFGPVTTSASPAQKAPLHTRQPLTGASILYNEFAKGDANANFRIDNDGKIRIGAGGASAVDTELYRGAANQWKSDDEFKISRDTNAKAALTVAVDGEANARLQIVSDGSLNFGQGGASTLDAVLKWLNANLIGTASGDSFSVGGPTANAGAAAGIFLDSSGFVDLSRSSGTVALRTYTTGDANPKLQINLDGKINIGAGGASAVDVNLYRSAADTLKTDDKLVVALEFNPLGDINHDGSNIGFFGVAPAARAAAYTPTNVTTDRSFDADTVLIAELADVVGTLIADLKTYGLLQ